MHMSFHADTYVNSVLDNTQATTYFSSFNQFYSFFFIIDCDNLFKMESTYDVDTIQSHQNEALSKVKLLIHHQHPGIRLVSPIGAGDGAACHLSPAQKVDAGSIAQVGLNIDLSQEESTSVLLYKLQRKNIDTSNEKSTSSKDKAICIYFVVIWKIYMSGNFRVALNLTERDRDYVWNSNRLMKLTECCELFDVRHNFIEYTRLIHDNIMLMAGVTLTREEECYKLEMTISEANINWYIQRLHYIGLNK
jgi:hypothetical protein